MGLLDSILNLICAFLWFNWRWIRFLAREKSWPVSLAATLKRTAPRPRGRWMLLLTLVALLGLRGIFYWNVGSALNWTPTLELCVISLPFRSDYLGRMLLFSVLSLALMLGGLYAWLLLISVVNRNVPSDEPVQRIVRLHLGRVERCPVAVKLLLPVVVSTLIWGLASPGLVRLGILPRPVSAVHLWEQAALIGVTSLLWWKLLILVICLLYLLNSYVYVGSSYFWTYVNTTGSNLLAPLRRLPVRVRKVDLSPVIAIVLVLAITRWASLWLPWLFGHLPI
jgi:uncharacterized protein YggT (Ycf19 family)